MIILCATVKDSSVGTGFCASAPIGETEEAGLFEHGHPISGVVPRIAVAGAPAIRGSLNSTSPRGILERMPTWLICVPLVMQWLWLALRYRSATLPSACNPRITAGGLVGEGKLEYFAHMGPVAHSATARHVAWRNSGAEQVAACESAMKGAQLGFPIIAKPDLGLCGHGVCRLDGIDDLRQYLSHFPLQETVVLQEYLSQEGEAGIFYARMPGAAQGSITGIALRSFPQVVGDGQRSIGDLVAADERLGRLSRTDRHRSRYDAGRVPACGERVRLATIGSTRVGGLYRSGSHLATAQLAAAIDAIAQDMGEFYAGRFDVRFENEAALADGHGFRIMEINGAGSEAIEAWDPAAGMYQAFHTIFTKQALLFRIGAMNRCAGAQPIGLTRLLKLQLRQRALIASYPPSN